MARLKGKACAAHRSASPGRERPGRARDRDRAGKTMPGKSDLAASFHPVSIVVPSVSHAD